MNSKLEEKLLQYDEAAAILTERELIDAIDRIIDAEMARPDDEIDFDLINEAIETVKLLGNIDFEQRKKEADALTKKIIAEVNSQDVLRKKQKKARVMKKKWIIPIAAILSLIIAGTIISYAMGFDFMSIPNRLFRQLERKTEHNNDNNSSYVITDDARTYKSFDEMISHENFTELLWPGEENYADNITVKDYGEYVDISSAFNIDGETARYNISLHKSIPEIDQEPTRIGNYDVYIVEYDNVFQAEFNYKDNKYTLRASYFKTLEEFINSLEEK